MANISEYLASTGEAIVDPFVIIWGNMINLLPGIFAAVLILVVGVLLSMLLESIVSKSLRKFGLDNIMEQYKLSDAIEDYNLSTLCGKLAFWYVLVIFLGSAIEKINIPSLSNILNRFANWLPDLIAAIVIFIAGILLGQIIYNKIIQNVKTRKNRVKPFAKGVKILVIFFITMIAVGQLGIRIILVEQTWLIIVSAVALAIAISIGISLGHAMKEPMKKVVKKVSK